MLSLAEELLLLALDDEDGTLQRLPEHRLECTLVSAVLMDLCSRRIVGWSLRERLSGELTLEALDRALEARQPQPGLLHHSDRGSQYGIPPVLWTPDQAR